MSKRSLFLVVSEGAWCAVEGLPPTGAYGVDWCVMSAVSGADALRQAPAMVTGQLPISGEDDAECLPERLARHAFEEAHEGRRGRDLCSRCGGPVGACACGRVTQ